MRRDLAEVDKGEHDAKHDQPAVEDAGHREHAHGRHDRGTRDRDAKRGRGARDAHDGRFESAEHLLVSDARDVSLPELSHVWYFYDSRSGRSTVHLFVKEI